MFDLSLESLRPPHRAIGFLFWRQTLTTGGFYCTMLPILMLEDTVTIRYTSDSNARGYCYAAMQPYYILSVGEPIYCTNIYYTRTVNNIFHLRGTYILHQYICTTTVNNILEGEPHSRASSPTCSSPPALPRPPSPIRQKCSPSSSL